MSKRYSPTVQFTCTNGCEVYGQCPGHEMRIMFLLTSDNVVVQERNIGQPDEQWADTASFDDGRWCAMFNADERDKEQLAARKPTGKPNG